MKNGYSFSEVLLNISRMDIPEGVKKKEMSTAIKDARGSFQRYIEFNPIIQAEPDSKYQFSVEGEIKEMKRYPLRNQLMDILTCAEKDIQKGHYDHAVSDLVGIEYSRNLLDYYASAPKEASRAYETHAPS